MLIEREYKRRPAFVTKADENEGIVEAIFAVMGVVDEGLDRIHNGAFAKTFVERGHKVRLLDSHNAHSVLNSLGKVMALKEIGEGDLPIDLVKAYPDATGGAWAQLKFNLNTANGHDAFQHIRAGDVDEWSFAYDATNKDFEDIEGPDGATQQIRNLKELRLYEVSPTVFGMNPATTTVGAKSKDTKTWTFVINEGKYCVYEVGTDGHAVGDILKRFDKQEEAETYIGSLMGVKEGKPWDVVTEGGQYCVYKVDADGNPTGEAMSCYDNESDAQDYVAALYANTEEEFSKQEPGGPETCVCPDCGYETEKERGIPCRSMECPECGVSLVAGTTETDSVDKSVNLSEMVNTVRAAFEGEHNAEDGPWDYWVATVYDDYVVVEYYPEGKHYAVSYARNEDGIAFADKDTWVEGSLEFVPNVEVEEMTDPLENIETTIINIIDGKAGRVLAQRNADRLVGALQTLLDVLEDAGIDVPGYESGSYEEPEEDEDEDEKASAAQEAGPIEISPTFSTEIEKELIDIELYL